MVLGSDQPIQRFEYLDTRTGNARHVIDTKPPMLIPDNMRKCVAFLAYDTGDGERIVGTGFLVSLPIEGYAEESFTYLVTARHVVDGVARKSVDGHVLIRVNLKAGGVHFYEVAPELWYTSDDGGINDVAVLPFPGRDWDEIDIAAWRWTNGAVNEDVIRSQGIGLGDEVVSVGLFVNHAGTERNIPIVRVGNVAAMPEEPINSDLGMMDAFLIEARSIGGLSGSPVFVNTGIDRSDPSRVLNAATLVQTRLWLLGVMHGHWDTKIAQDAIMDVDGPGVEKVNLGIAVVSPASKIADILYSPELVAMREKNTKKLKAETAATSDLADDPTDDGVSLAPLEFEEALKGLLGTPKPETGE